MILMKVSLLLLEIEKEASNVMIEVTSAQKFVICVEHRENPGIEPII